VVSNYLDKAGLTPYLDALNFNLVGYGCTTCIGNSGPLPEPVSAAVKKEDLVVAAVLSGNRNFEGRVNPQVKANYLASPPLVVAYALAGTVDFDIANDSLGTGSDGKPVYLKDIWPSPEEVESTIRATIDAEMFRSEYEKAFEGDKNWQTLPVPTGSIYQWDADSTYIQKPPYFDNMVDPNAPIEDLKGARVAGAAGRFDDDGSHFASGFDCGELSGGTVFDFAGCEGRGFQFVWRSAREPSGDGARDAGECAVA